MKYLAIYNAKNRLVELEESIDESSTLPLMAMIGGKETKTGEVNELDHRRQMLSLECVNRGTLDGEWKVYEGDTPFEWKEEAENA